MQAAVAIEIPRVEQPSLRPGAVLGLGHFRELVRHIQQALADVNPMTVEEWEESFSRETQPAREIAYWLNVAQRYTFAITEQTPLTERKKRLHRILTAGYPRHVVPRMLSRL